METCRLNRSHVRPGVPLPGNVYDSNGQLLLSKGYVPDSEAQIEGLLARGMYVELSVFESLFKAPAGDAPSGIEKRYDPFQVRDTLKISLNRLLRGAVDGTETPARIAAFAEQLQTFVDSDAEAAIAASLLDRHEETYPVSHSLNTATLCALLAERLEWPAARRRSVVCAALTMNLGMFDLQQRLVRQATPLQTGQQAQVLGHPEVSLSILEKIGVADPLWLAVARQHHEKAGGDGYPQQLPAPAEEAQLVRLVDIFLARCAARADRRPLAPASVLRALFMEEGGGAQATLVAALFKLLGLHPPGSFVRLENNELAVVFRADPENKALAVAAVTTASGAPTMQPVRRDTYRKGFAVAAAVPYDKVSVGYDLGKLWLGKAQTAGS